MDLLVLLLVGVLTGLTTVLFGFGGGFVVVPVVAWADADLGTATARVAVATSAAVMVVNAAVATAATPRAVLVRLRTARGLLVLLAAGGALGAVLAGVAPPAVPRWGFVGYLAGTIVDVLVRPGFLGAPAPAPARRAAIPAALGAPIGTVASFLGVGGSVLTVPLLRRRGETMRTATALANPLTLAISLPALAVFLLGAGHGAGSLVGTVDVPAAVALLLGAMPVIVLLRRRPPRLPDRAHALAYVALLVVSGAAMTVAALR